MGLSVGIVGLPNVGKSTLFNALLKKQQAYAANFPFATIEPNIGVVPVPDERLKKLAKVVKNAENMQELPPEVPATVEFLDIAGLIAGAHKGEGLGNKFLSHIREVNAICHVVRTFTDPDVVKEGSVDPVEDLEVVETELMLADLQTLEKQKDPGMTSDKEERKRWDVVVKLKQTLESDKPARKAELNEDERKVAKELSLLTSKLILIVLNVDETELERTGELEEEYAEKFGVDTSQVIAISAKIESQVVELSEQEQSDYLTELGVDKPGLERVIKKAYETLGLITFFSANEKEAHAWTLNEGRTAYDAAGVIHTDFQEHFIKAEVIDWKDFVEHGGWKNAREAGKVRIEGREYIIQEGDMTEFKVGT